jgi:hypothetical protein
MRLPARNIGPLKIETPGKDVGYCSLYVPVGMLAYSRLLTIKLGGGPTRWYCTFQIIREPGFLLLVLDLLVLA